MVFCSGQYAKGREIKQRTKPRRRETPGASGVRQTGYGCWCWCVGVGDGWMPVWKRKVLISAANVIGRVSNSSTLFCCAGETDRVGTRCVWRNGWWAKGSGMVELDGIGWSECGKGINQKRCGQSNVNMKDKRARVHWNTAREKRRWNPLPLGRIRINRTHQKSMCKVSSPLFSVSLSLSISLSLSLSLSLFLTFFVSPTFFLFSCISQWP